MFNARCYSVLHLPQQQQQKMCYFPSNIECSWNTLIFVGAVTGANTISGVRNLRQQPNSWDEKNKTLHHDRMVMSAGSSWTPVPPLFGEQRFVFGVFYFLVCFFFVFFLVFPQFGILCVFVLGNASIKCIRIRLRSLDICQIIAFTQPNLAKIID